MKSVLTSGRLASKSRRLPLSPLRTWASALLLAVSGPFLQADELIPQWQILPGDRAYITTGNTERGMAFNAATGRLLVVSRAAGISVTALDGATGEERHQLLIDGVAGGTFALNMIGVAEDGAVYAANLSTSTTSPNFKIYRWANDGADTLPTIAFEGDPSGINEATGASKNPQRWGDSFDVRGSGVNTMILAGSRASSAVAIFTTTDGMNFTAKIVTGAAAAAGSLSVAFGEGNTLWTKVLGQPLRYASFDLAAGQASLLQQFGEPIFPNAVAPIAVHAAKKWLAAVTLATPDDFRLYDISNPSVGVVLIDQEILPTDNANANGVGAVDFGAAGGNDLVFALDTNNGIVAYRVEKVVGVPPAITAQPQSLTVLEGADVSFTVTASGTTPFQYQWLLNGANIAGATNAILSLAKVQAATAGKYSVAVKNSAGSVTSSEAVLTVNPLVRSEVLTPLWKIAPGDRAYVTTDNTQRGVAINPVTGNVLLVSRAGGNRIYVLDGKTGAELRQLNLDSSIVSGGTFVINMIGVAADGAVYAGNLVTDSIGGGYTLYRWANDNADTVPTVAFRGDPSAGDASATNRRFGDSMDVRGSGAGTQILLASRGGTLAVLFTTPDGIDFLPNLISTDAAAGDLGLSVTFGEGNSFWGTASARPVRLIDFNLATGLGVTRHSLGAAEIPTNVASIGVNPSAKLLAGIAHETPDTLRLYDLAKLPEAPTLSDQQAFPTDNANANGTGSVDFGAGRVAALNTNNGLMVFTVNTGAVSAPKAATLSGASRKANGSFEFLLSGTAGAAYVVEASSDFKTWTTVSTVTVSAGGSLTVTDPSPAGTSRFYRATAKQ